MHGRGHIIIYDLAPPPTQPGSSFLQIFCPNFFRNFSPISFPIFCPTSTSCPAWRREWSAGGSRCRRRPRSGSSWPIPSTTKTTKRAETELWPLPFPRIKRATTNSIKSKDKIERFESLLRKKRKTIFWFHRRTDRPTKLLEQVVTTAEKERSETSWFGVVAVLSNNRKTESQLKLKHSLGPEIRRPFTSLSLSFLHSLHLYFSNSIKSSLSPIFFTISPSLPVPLFQ